MNATIKDICEATGFSTATVSRVLNDSPLVTEATKKRVRAALEKFGYQPHYAARALKLNEAENIAVVFPDLDNGFYTNVLRGVNDMASEFKKHLITAFAHSPRDEREMVLRIARERRADALILMNLTLKDAFLRQLKQWDLPVVLIDRPVAGDAHVSVGMDNRAAVAEMVRHLHQLGHRSIAFVAGPKGTYDADERLHAFQEAMAGRGLSARREMVWQGDFTEEGGARLMAERLQQNIKLPDAIFAANDQMAAGIYRVLRDANYEIPNDVALVGFDDTDVARYLGLTTLHVPMHEIGRTAARLAIALIDGPVKERRVLLPTRLVIRQSCGSSMVPSRSGGEP